MEISGYAWNPALQPIRLEEFSTWPLPPSPFLFTFPLQDWGGAIIFHNFSSSLDISSHWCLSPTGHYFHQPDGLRHPGLLWSGLSLESSLKRHRTLEELSLLSTRTFTTRPLMSCMRAFGIVLSFYSISVEAALSVSKAIRPQIVYTLSSGSTPGSQEQLIKFIQALGQGLPC